MASYTGSGGITLGGCAYYSFTPNYDRAWEVGEKVYLRRLAVNGHIEWVYIKIIRGTSNPIYIDTLNASHAEGDLCTEQTALELAINYYERYVAMLREQLGCFPDTSGS